MRRATSRLASKDEADAQSLSVAAKAFVDLVEADGVQSALEAHRIMSEELTLPPGPHGQYWPALKAAVKEAVPYRHREIFTILSTKAKGKAYQGYPASGRRVLVAGAGPCGLRAAIEAQLLGASVAVVERREEFTRHNILKLWKFLLVDFKSLAVKKFVGRFCSGQINHVGIKALQLFLLKVSLILGVRIFCPCKLINLREPEGGEDDGWRAELDDGAPAEAEEFQFGTLIVASGKRVAVDGFNRRSLDAKLSIAVTANFVNGNTREEAMTEQISGLSRQYHQDFFKEMREEIGVDLENIVYYRGDTHYFVMTVSKATLLAKGVIKEDGDDRRALLSPSNVDRDLLHIFAREVSCFATERLSSRLAVDEFALDGRGRPDCAVFDFTNLYSARNACAVRVRRGAQLLQLCVGDSLLEPFWPEGTGCGRGVLSALDAAWTLRQWCLGRANPLELISERENIYKLLSQTADGGGQLKENYKVKVVIWSKTPVILSRSGLHH